MKDCSAGRPCPPLFHPPPGTRGLEGTAHPMEAERRIPGQSGCLPGPSQSGGVGKQDDILNPLQWAASKPSCCTSVLLPDVPRPSYFPSAASAQNPSSQGWMHKSPPGPTAPRTASSLYHLSLVYSPSLSPCSRHTSLCCSLNAPGGCTPGPLHRCSLCQAVPPHLPRSDSSQIQVSAKVSCPQECPP